MITRIGWVALLAAFAGRVDDAPAQALAQQGVELQASPTPEHFTAFIKSEVARAAKIVQDAGIKPE